MKKEFVVERQGKSFVLYAGLLDLAHQSGLKSIETTLVQVPSEANNRIAICTCVVIMERDGVERRFTGIGDAAPNNVAPAMQSCLIRMAETRSKARALRDAVNVGVAAFEEMGLEDAIDGAPEGGYGNAPRPASRNRAAAPSPQRHPAPVAASGKPKLTVSSENDLITDQQIEAIRNLCKRRNVVEPEALETLTQEQARELIKSLNKAA